MLDQELQLCGIYSYINSEEVKTDLIYSDLCVCTDRYVCVSHL